MGLGIPLFSKQRWQAFAERHLPFSRCWRNPLYQPNEIILYKKDDIVMFFILEEYKNLVEMPKFRLILKSSEQFHECRIPL